MARFDNKVVLVSGGARGQGAAEARLLVAQGAKVVIGDVLDNQGQTLAVELGPAACFIRHDVTSEADWARAVEAAEKLGGLHGLVNNAGIYQPAALMETDDALWQRHIQINQYGCFLGMKAVVPAMEFWAIERMKLRPSSQVRFGSTGTTTWMPFWPLNFGQGCRAFASNMSRSFR